MRQPDLVPVRGDQPVRFGLEQRVLGSQSFDLLEREWLAEREQFDRLQVTCRQAVHSLADQVDQRRTRGEAALESPEPGRPDERARLDGAADKLAHVQHVSPADLGHPVKRGLLHRVTERRLDEGPDRIVAEVGELHSPGGVVLPQRNDRVGARLAGAHRREHERRPRRREMQDERGRNRVEQLRIVDADHDLTASSAGAELLAAASHQRDDVVGANLVGHEIGHGRERNRSPASRRLHPVDERALALRRVLCLPGQTRLPDPGVSDKDHTMAPRAGSSRRDRLEFAIATHERPHARQRGSMPLVPRHMRSNSTPSIRGLTKTRVIRITRTGRASPRRRPRPARHGPARSSGLASRAPRPGLPTAARGRLGRRAPAS